ncbi:glutaredoxin family protein [Saccharospirillum mangrovi]|uniref:glutaredoxin family protein n=1 Tax=Saccharospirillum mangrovi TaxID=2161747 RepID=UPI001E45C625|nr:glutaredoxin family protein [Saccharospirillum mangrovi]
MSSSDPAVALPTSEPRLTLYSTAGCHLCEQAEALLQALALRWEVVDIASSDALIDQYGVRIPVLKAGGTDTDLGWPFTADDVQQYLQNGDQS